MICKLADRRPSLQRRTARTDFDNRSKIFGSTRAFAWKH